MRTKSIVVSILVGLVVAQPGHSDPVWESAGLSGLTPFSLAVAESTLFACVQDASGSAGRGLWSLDIRSSEPNWQSVAFEDTALSAVTIDPSTGRLYVTLRFPELGGALVFRSEDDGSTWQDITHDATGSFAGGVAVSVTDPAVLYLATDDAVFRSVDDGESWGVATTGARYFTIQIDEMTGSLWATWGSDLFRGGVTYSADGEGWDTSVQCATGAVGRLSIDYSSGSVFVGQSPSCGGGLFRTTDDGESWDSITLPEPIYAFAVAATGGDVVVGDLSTPGIESPIYLSRDDGQTWDAAIMGLPPDADTVYDIASDRYSEGVFYAALGGGFGVYRLDVSAEVGVNNDVPQPDWNVHATTPCNHLNLVVEGLAAGERVRATVFDLAGREVAHKESASASEASGFTFDLGAGVYFWTLEADRHGRRTGKYVQLAR